MKITPGILQIAALLIAPVAALVGVWLSPRLTARMSQRHWLRERQASAYVSAIQATESIRLNSFIVAAIDDLEPEPPMTSQHNSSTPQPSFYDVAASVQQDISGRFMPLLRADSEISIFGDEATYRAMQQLLRDLIELEGAKGSKEERSPAGHKVYISEMRLINQCPTSLGMPPITDRG